MELPARAFTPPPKVDSAVVRLVPHADAPNAELIDATYRIWLDNPDAVDPTWRAFFQGFALGSNGGPITTAVEAHQGRLNGRQAARPRSTSGWWIR